MVFEYLPGAYCECPASSAISFASTASSRLVTVLFIIPAYHWFVFSCSSMVCDHAGGALSTVLEKRNGRLLPFKIAGRFALDCAQGLRYLHEHKPTEVVHRFVRCQRECVRLFSGDQ